MRPGPRPLLGILEIFQHTESGGALRPALIVEGEKNFFSAQKAFGHKYHVVTWAGGVNAVEKSDWLNLVGIKKFYIWADADEAGISAAEKIKTILSRPIFSNPKIVIRYPKFGEPNGFDVSDWLKIQKNHDVGGDKIDESKINPEA